MSHPSHMQKIFHDLMQDYKQLLQCQSILCLHLVNLLSLWCFSRELFLLPQLDDIFRDIDNTLQRSSANCNFLAFHIGRICQLLLFCLSVPVLIIPRAPITSTIVWVWKCQIFTVSIDTLAPYLFIICLDYVLRTSIDKIKENIYIYIYIYIYRVFQNRLKN